MVMMTKQQALDIQLKQLIHYAEVYGGAAMGSSHCPHLRIDSARGS